MKNKSLFIVLMALMLGLTACESESTDGGSDGGDNGGAPPVVTTPKATISLWTVGNSAWTMDLSAGNLTGTPFTAVLAFSNGEICNCQMTLSGTESAGTSTWGSCVNAGPGTPNCAFFDNMHDGTYTNGGTNFRTSNSGAVYH